MIHFQFTCWSFLSKIIDRFENHQSLNQCSVMQKTELFWAKKFSYLPVCQQTKRQLRACPSAGQLVDSIQIVSGQFRANFSKSPNYLTIQHFNCLRFFLSPRTIQLSENFFLSPQTIQLSNNPNLTVSWKYLRGRVHIYYTIKLNTDSLIVYN